MFIKNILLASALAFIATPALADDPPKMTPMKIAKECSEFTGKTPSFCTITESDFAPLPKGTKIFYHQPTNGAPILGDTPVTITTEKGSLVGRCITFEMAVPFNGICAFTSGTGELEGFVGALNVTADEKDKTLYHWNGGYITAKN